MYVGKPLRRREDAKFITGKGCYVDDISFPDLLHIVFVRSPHAHARIVEVTTETAGALPGIVRIVTGHDWHDGVGDHGSKVVVNTGAKKTCVAAGIFRSPCLEKVDDFRFGERPGQL